MRTEKEIFNESMKKYLKTTKKALLITFSIFGCFFVILGVMLGTTVEQSMFLFMGIGGSFIFLGIILYFAIPNSFNFERYKKHREKYGMISYYQIAAKVEYLEEKSFELESRIKELENK